MARVPTYDEPQVEAKALPGFRQDTVATPALLGGKADSLAGLGAGLVTAGTGAAAIFEHMQERDDMALVLGIETKVKEDLIAREADIRANRQGAKAEKLTQETRDWWEERKRVDSQVLKTDRQRELYRRRLGATRLQSIEGISKYEANQGEVALDQSAKAAVAASINSAAAAVTSGSTMEEISRAVVLEADNIRKVNGALAVRRGWAEGKDGKPGVLDVVNGEDITRLHKQVIEALVANNKDLATTYFEKYKDQIDGSARNQLGESAKKGTAEAVGRATAGEIWATVGYAAGVDKMVQAARDKLKDNTFALSAAIADIKERTSLFEHAEKTRSEALLSKLNIAAANGASLPQLRNMPEFNTLLTSGPTGEKQIAQLIAHEESRAATRASRAASEAARGAANEQRAEAAERRQQYRLTREGLNTYMSLVMNPDKVASLTDNQVINLRQIVGDDNALNISRMKANLTKSAEALAASRIDTQTLREVALSAGLDTESKGLTEREKHQIIRLQGAINDRLVQAVQIKGRPLDYAERKKEAQAAADDVFRTPGFFNIGGMGTSNAQPYSTMTPEQQKTAFIDLPKGRVRLAEIPDLFSGEARVALQKAGRVPTQKAIAEMWLLNKDSWKNGLLNPTKPIRYAP